MKHQCKSPEQKPEEQSPNLDVASVCIKAFDENGVAVPEGAMLKDVAGTTIELRVTLTCSKQHAGRLNAYLRECIESMFKMHMETAMPDEQLDMYKGATPNARPIT